MEAAEIDIGWRYCTYSARLVWAGTVGHSLNRTKRALTAKWDKRTQLMIVYDFYGLVKLISDQIRGYYSIQKLKVIVCRRIYYVF